MSRGMTMVVLNCMRGCSDVQKGRENHLEFNLGMLKISSTRLCNVKVLLQRIECNKGVGT